jgi:DNA-binding NtrC family response regulator
VIVIAPSEQIATQSQHAMVTRRVITQGGTSRRKYFLDELDRKHHLGRKHVSPEVLDAFLGYRWPGNVRELANVLEGVYVTIPGQEVRLEHLPNRIREVAILHPAGHFQPHAYREALRRFRLEYFKQVLAFSGGEVTNS